MAFPRVPVFSDVVPTDFFQAVALGEVPNCQMINKFGRNPDLDTGVTEDVWNGSSTYTGFPDGSAETLEFFSSSASDAAAGTGARQVRFMGLDQNWNQASETITLNGTTPVTTTSLWRRVHTAAVVAAGSGGVNAGNITCRHSTTTANRFFFMPVGTNQTYVMAYTVPDGYRAILVELTATLGTSGGAVATCEGYIWTREFGAPFRARRPALFATNTPFVVPITGGLVFGPKADLTYRVFAASANNLTISVGMDLLLVRNT